MQRPTAVSVFGILNALKGATGILGILWTITLFSSRAAANNPVMKLMLENGKYMKWTKLMTPVGFITCGVLLAAGIGLLRLRPWARKVSIAYAIYAILFLLAMVPVNFFLLYRPMLEQARQLQGPEAIGMIGGAFGGIVGSVLGFVYPILLWIFMTRPNVVAAFQTPPPLPPELCTH